MTLKLGRPENRVRRTDGDRRDILDDPPTWGPDAHGVFWKPVRAYYDAEPDQTLLVIAPIHPDDIPVEVKSL